MSKQSDPVARPVRRAFTSDNIAGASPQVLAAIAAIDEDFAPSYGADDSTARVEEQLKAIFECDLKMFLVPTGSAANALSLSVMTPPWGSVFCHPDSHINNDECGAPEFFTNGAKLITLGGADGKLDPHLLAAESRRKVGDVHSTQPACVSITQATEVGSLYTVQEVARIGEICKAANLRLHMDGSRFANALVALNCTPAEMTWKAGVDVLSFGATKNGVLAAEAIILFDTSLATEMGFRRKRGGHLFSKMRLLSAQMEAYLQDDLWLHNARQANAMAQRLVAGLRPLAGVEFQGVPQANMLFCKLPAQVIARLLAQDFRFYHDRWGADVVRLVTSFATREIDVDHFITAVREAIAQAQ